MELMRAGRECLRGDDTTDGWGVTQTDHHQPPMWDRK
jgi:hypothetical protein